MSESGTQSAEDKRDALAAAVATQGQKVRGLKQGGAPQEEVTAAVNELKRLKIELAAAAEAAAGSDNAMSAEDRGALDDMLLRRMFVVPAFEIHGGVAGLYDFGPPGCSLKDNVLNAWKRHFVLQENMLSVDCTNLTPHAVLHTSGHVERFTDLMVKDTQSGECYRADKLLEAHLENMMEDSSLSKERREELQRIHIQADAYTPKQLHDLIVQFGIKSPSTGGELSEPFPFNLMFKTTIGPEGHSVGYLRPETAQGIFVNFRRLLDYNNGKMPFAAAQVGLGFRNEISPRAGLIRVREFCMAEIEHFCHPEEKDHPKFDRVKDIELCLFPQKDQLGTGKTVTMTAGKAVADGIIDNQTLAYFMARTHLFLLSVGIDPERLRFRQHLPTEMAHYASDCWDAEIKLSIGWTECVGHADRACYDLKVHTEKTNVELMASRKYPDGPKKVDIAKMAPKKAAIAKAFKSEIGDVIKMLAGLNFDDAMAVETALAAEGKATVGPDCEGKTFEVTRDMVSFKKTTKKISEERYFPGVIEPSFGIGRILYSIMEHSYYTRPDEKANAESEKQSKKKKKGKGNVQRAVLKFPPAIAPVKVGVFPLQKKASMERVAADITADLADANLRAQCDTSGATIGKKYARMDEIGAPFAITVDGNSIEGEVPTVTLRERDSQAQVTLPIKDVVSVVDSLCAGRISWNSLQSA